MKAFTHSFSPFASTAMTILSYLLLAFIAIDSHAQFQKYFGSNLNNSFGKVILDGGDYYVLGQDQPTVGSLSNATISRLAFDGKLLWTRSLDIASQWNDAIRINPSGDLLVVGNSLPLANPFGKSIMGRIDASGNFAWVREYDAPERDLFLKIIENPIPQNPSFPYYVLGGQKEIPGLSQTWDDVVLLNMNANGNFLWKRIYKSADDDEFFRDIEALPNGNLILSGSRQNTLNDHSGIIYMTGSNGKIISGKIANWMNYPDMVQEGIGGGFYTASNSEVGQAPFLSKFDQNLNQLWQVQIPSLISLSQVWVSAPGVIYTTGVGSFGSATRAVIMKFIDNSPNAPTLVWTKYLNAGSNFFGGTSSLLPGNNLVFTDGRLLTQGFGGHDAHISISDLDLNTCMVTQDNVTLVTTTLAPINYKLYNDSLINPINGINLTSKLVSWEDGDFCIDCCANSLTFSKLINQGFTVVQSNCKFTITAPQFDSCYLFSTPPSLDGANVPQVITNPNGSWSYSFTSSGTHQVCVNVLDECNSKKMCTTVNVTCDTCICGPFDLQYSLGRGPLLPYDCGDTLEVPSSMAITPIRFLSSFKCLGTKCPQATVDLILTGPPGFIPITISGVQAIPDFILPFTNSTFSIAGIYTLTINGHCGNNICPCTIYFNANGHDCCSNQFDFELAITNAVTITVDNTKCKTTLNIGNLPKCDSIGPIFWGDGTATQGNFVAGTMPMHSYAGIGTYYITWTATEYDYSVMPPRKCFEKVFRDSIKVVCCTAQYTFVDDSCGKVSFTSIATGTPGYSYYWDFGNPVSGPNNNSTLSNPLHKFSANGFYTVTLTITDAMMCVSTYTSTINVQNIFGNINFGLTGYFDFNGLTSSTPQPVPDQTAILDGIGINVLPALVNACNFNGSSSYIACGTNDRGVTNKVSVSAWIRTTETNNGMWIAGKYLFGDDKGYSLGVGDNTNSSIGKVAFGGRDGTGTYHSSGYNLLANPKVNDGNWHCVVGTAGNNLWSVYVDGVHTSQQVGSTVGGLATGANVNFTIGRNSSPSGGFLWFNGDMDEVRVYNRVLTDCEICTLCATRISVASKDINNSKWKVTIFPNPNNGTFNIELPSNASSDMMIRIIDLNGKLQMMSNCEMGNKRQSVDASSLVSGLYFLQVVQNGRVVSVNKFVQN